MLTIARRFNGPPESGNGGYVAGVLAQRYLETFGATPGAKVEVTLRKPPPLEKPLEVRQPEETESLRLLYGSTVVAEAELVEASAEPIEPISYEEAVTAAKGYLGIGDHPFLTCFVCGPSHPSGLHIYPGAVTGRRKVVAAPWTPAEDTIGPEFVWAALDCPGGWSPGDLAERPMVLGRFGVETFLDDDLLQAGEQYVLLGRHVRTEGRKTFTESTLYGPSGEAVAHAEAVWIAVDPTTVRPTD